MTKCASSMANMGQKRPIGYNCAGCDLILALGADRFISGMSMDAAKMSKPKMSEQ